MEGRREKEKLLDLALQDEGARGDLSGGRGGGPRAEETPGGLAVLLPAHRGVLGPRAAPGAGTCLHKLRVWAAVPGFHKKLHLSPSLREARAGP